MGRAVRKGLWVGVGGLLLALGLLSAAVAWRVQALPADHAAALLRTLAAEHEAMWASVWGPLPARTEGRTSYASRSWSLWPRPQVHLNDVRWSVPAELSGTGQLRIERLTLGLGWASLWGSLPQVHEVRVQGLAGSSRHTPWGLLSEWRVREARLGPAGVDGVRTVALTLESSLRAVRPAVVPAAPAVDTAAPWLSGLWTGQARWHPPKPGDAGGVGAGAGDLAGESAEPGRPGQRGAPDQPDGPGEWQQVDLRFQGELGGQRVPSARMTLGRWQHHRAQERLAWEDLVLQLQLGEGGQSDQLELRSAGLDLGPDSARGKGWTGSWQTAAPLPLSWQMDSAAPRGRYTAITWPRWRLVPSGRDGSRAGGQLQADLSWFPDRRSLRWDALLGELSLQPRGEAERQWSVRGQFEMGMRASSWQLEGQAQGGAPDAVSWDGPFATEGEWRRWPQPKADLRVSLASLWPERLWIARPAAAGSVLSPAQTVSPAVPKLVAAFWPGLADTPADLRLQVGQLVWRDLRLTGVDAQLTQQGDAIAMPAMSARLWGGALSAQGTWQRTDGRWQVSARSRDAELGPLRQALDSSLALGRVAPNGAARVAIPGGPNAALPPSTPARKPDAASGRWNGTTTLSGRGDDVRQWRGSWSFDALAGHWMGFDLQAARDAARDTQRDIRKLPPRKESADDRTTWRRLQAAGKVDGGVAHIERFALVGAAGRLAASGTLDLQDGAVALAWSDLLGERARGPVFNMTGPWRSPQTQHP